MITYPARLAFESSAELGEGALWDTRLARLWWVDILNGRLFRFDPETKTNESFEIGSPVGTVVPEEGKDVALAVKDGFASFDTKTGKLEMLAALEHGDDGARFNDGKCDPEGRFWAGTIGKGAKPGGANLFCLERDLSVSRKIKGVSISNGLGWNQASDKMLYIDSPSQRVLEFAYDRASGNITAPRVAIEIPKGEGEPDGLCMDSEGMVWIAIWGGAKAARFNPATGERLAEVPVEGARHTSSVALGGKNMCTLFITTAREGLSPESRQAQPLAGSLFSAEVAVAGVPANPFKRT